MRVALLCAALTYQLSFAQHWTFAPHQVQGQLYMLEPANTNGNVGVMMGDDGVLLLDSYFQPAVPKLLQEVAALTDEDFKFLVNTHIHPDHIGGNSLLADYGVTIVAHDLVRVQMLKEPRIPRRGVTFYPMPDPRSRPVLTYTDAISFHLNGEEVQVFHAPPAHTGGDSFVYFTGSDVSHLGDVFRTTMYPIIDHYIGGSFLGMIEAMSLAIGMAGPGTKMILGHGQEPSDRQGMIDYENLLSTLRDRVQGFVDREASIEQMLAANPTEDLDLRWGGVPPWTAGKPAPDYL